MKSFMRYVVVVSMLFAFAGQSSAGLFKPELKDIVWISVSGEIWPGYDTSDFIHDDDEYAKLVTRTLAKEMKRAAIDCRENRQVLFTNSGVLTPEVKEIYDSLKKDANIDSYLIISALLYKYAKNKDDIYFHKDFRDDHPECLNVWDDEKCNKLKKNYYFDEDTPVRGLTNPSYGHTVERASLFDKITTGKTALTDSELIRFLLPEAYMPKTRELYKGFINQVISELIPLKSCLAEVTEIDSVSGSDRRKNGTPLAEKNAVFDKFRTQEVIKR